MKTQEIIKALRSTPSRSKRTMLDEAADRLERQAPIGRGEMVRTIRVAARMLEKDENQVEWGEVSPEVERLYNNLKER